MAKSRHRRIISLVSFALVAVEFGFVCPKICPPDLMPRCTHATAVRHILQELCTDQFIPNDVFFSDGWWFRALLSVTFAISVSQPLLFLKDLAEPAILCGANDSGKSNYLKLVSKMFGRGFQRLTGVTFSSETELRPRSASCFFWTKLEALSRQQRPISPSWTTSFLSAAKLKRSVRRKVWNSPFYFWRAQTNFSLNLSVSHSHT